MGQTTVRKGRGNSTVSKSTFCGGGGGGFYLNYFRYTYIFHNRECDFLNIFFGGDNPRMGGGMSPPSPPGFTPMHIPAVY